MSLKYIYLILGSCLLNTVCTAHVRNMCADEKKDLFQKLARATVADTGENNYDIQYVKLNLNLDNVSTNIQGDVTTVAVVTASELNEYVFELNPDLTIDSVLFNGNSVAVVPTGTSIRSIPLGMPLKYNALFTVEVFYHGTGVPGTGFFTHGLNLAALPSGTSIMYTLSDPSTASDWWPCKQVLTDKIDSADIWVTIPKGTEEGSNGLLQSIVTIDSGHVQYRWKTRYPIDYYLLSVAIAPYTDYKSYIHFTGSTDSMLIQNFVYDTATFNPIYKANFDSVGLMVDYFSTLYGRYPFYKEKYGMCFSNLSGGMEHQTITTIGVTETPLIAHELGHQWFGDCVTYQSWRDIWLSEGFASYTEQLYVEHFWGKTAAYNYRTTRYDFVTSSTGGSVYLDPSDTTNAARIFDTRLTYYKGAAVVHMLRFIAPNDSMFFQVLKNYQQKYAFSFASTDSLKAIASAVYSRNLDTFFNQWVYGQGFPVYSGAWNQKGNKVLLQLKQAGSYPSSVSIFATPLEIKFSSASGDTTIKVYNNQASELYNFSWANKVTGITIDPNNWILKLARAIVYDSTLSAGDIKTGTQYKIYPNPARAYWRVSALPSGTQMMLTDISGRALWKGVSNNDVIIPGNNLSAGTYILHCLANGSMFDISLVHW